MLFPLLPLLQAAAYTKEYTGAWAQMGAGLGAGLNWIDQAASRITIPAPGIGGASPGINASSSGSTAATR